MFIIFGGPPGCGKSTIAQALAKRLGADTAKLPIAESLELLAAEVERMGASQ
jgi:adenylate kinase family enzyme